MSRTASGVLTELLALLPLGFVWINERLVPGSHHVQALVYALLLGTLIGMVLLPLAGVGGVAVTQYLPCRKSAFSYRAAASNESIAGWRPEAVCCLWHS